MVSTHLKKKSKWESSPNRGENKKSFKPPPNFSSHGSFRVMRWNKPSYWEMLGALGSPKTLSTCAARLCCFGVLFVYLLVRSTMLECFLCLRMRKLGFFPCFIPYEVGCVFQMFSGWLRWLSHWSTYSTWWRILFFLDVFSGSEIEMRSVF